MKRNCVAALVALALGAPGAAFGQSSVTVSGFIKMGIEQLKLSQTAKSPSSESRVADDASRIIFSVVEDLGRGIQAVGQIDWRIAPDSGTDAASGNNWVGLRSRDWGSVTMGRHDLHYNNDPSEITAKAGSKKAGTVAILAYAGGGGTAIAGNTRTPNTVVWDSPKFDRFDLRLAYSTNPATSEADIGSSVRRGRAWNVVPRATGANWQLGWSHWDAKPDASLAGEQRADRVWGYYVWGGFRIGLAWDKSRIRTGGAADTSRRTAWSLPLRYRWGAHSFHVDFARAGDDRATAVADGAKMIALAYVYELSKRTSVGLSFARIRNEAGALYNFDGSAGGQGSPADAVAAGEDPRIFAATVRHSF
jgi:predicted porin